jgi:hypothetical protein
VTGSLKCIELESAADSRARSGAAPPVHLRVDISSKCRGFDSELIPEIRRWAVQSFVDRVGVSGQFAGIEGVEIGYEAPVRHCGCDSVQVEELTVHCETINHEFSAPLLSAIPRVVA